MWGRDQTFCCIFKNFAENYTIRYLYNVRKCLKHHHSQISISTLYCSSDNTNLSPISRVCERANRITDYFKIHVGHTAASQA